MFVTSAAVRRSVISIFLMACTMILNAQTPGPFRMIGTFHNIGQILDSLVGPGPEPGSQRVYASLVYSQGFEILSIDPSNGAITIFHSPILGELAARGLTVGPDGNLYMGTAPTGHFVKLDVRSGALIDMGIPSPTESYIWDMTLGSDNLIYAGTYPNCKLLQLDPITGTILDLGRLDPSQQYARYLIAQRDYIYAGIGTSAMNIAAYQISTHSTQEILPLEAHVPGIADVFNGVDGQAYATVGASYYRLNGLNAIRISSADLAATASKTILSDGNNASVTVQNGELVLNILKRGKVITSFQTAYGGEPNYLFRIGIGPDDNLYGSGSMPSDLVRFNLKSGTSEYLGTLGGGEVYSFLTVGNKLLMAAYGDTSTLFSYDPSIPFETNQPKANPEAVLVQNGNASWRPEAMVINVDGTISVGAIAGYGYLTGPLLSWDRIAGIVHKYQAIPDQSVATLTIGNGSLIGGTSIYGGGGSSPTQTSAVLFEWDPVNTEVQFTTVPVGGSRKITDLIRTSDGMVYGIADTTVFEFDPNTHKVTRTSQLPFSGIIYNSIALDEIGRIWGLSSQGIFTLDPISLTGRLVGIPPAQITGGFGMIDNTVYFISGSSIYSYVVPAPAPILSLLSGTYSGGQTVAIADAIQASKIYYTTDGSTPTIQSALYTGPIPLLSSNTIKAIAIADGYSPSEVTTAIYTVPSGFYISVSPATVAVPQGGSTGFAISVTAFGGFSGPVTVIAGDLPNGVTIPPTTLSSGMSQSVSLGANNNAPITQDPISITISGSSGALISTTSIQLRITPQPSFIAGPGGTTALSIAPGASSGNTGTVNVMGTNGFVGRIALTCTVSGNSATGILPTCSFNPTTLDIADAKVHSSAISVSTSAPNVAANSSQRTSGPLTGGTVLGLFTAVMILHRRRKAVIQMYFLLSVLLLSLTSCGGDVHLNLNPGTPPGNYIIVVTGSSGAINNTVGTINLVIE